MVTHILPDEKEETEVFFSINLFIIVNMITTYLRYVHSCDSLVLAINKHVKSTISLSLYSDSRLGLQSEFTLTTLLKFWSFLGSAIL